MLGQVAAWPVSEGAALLETSPQTGSDAEAQFRRTLSPALFPSWQATCQAFGAAIAAGPGLVMLVGRPGSGKTFTLLSYAGGTGEKAGMRSLDDPLEPGTQIDLVDNVHAKSLARLTPFDGTRVLAVEPKLAERLMRAFPRARIVAVQPMRSRDVHMMVEVRRPQLGLPVGYFTSKALARMDELCAGNPRRLDDLLFRSLRSAASAAVARVSPGHVEQAALQIAMEAGTGQDSAPLDREAALRLLGRAEEADQPWRRQRANAPGFWTGGTAARRDVRRIPALSARLPGKAAIVPKLVWRSAPLLISARKARPARDETFFAKNPAEAARAGSRRRQLGRKTSAVAAVAGVALAVMAWGLPRMLSWVAEGGQASAGAEPTTVASLAPTASAPPFPGAVPSPLPAPAARPVPPAGALLPSGRSDPAAPLDASSGTAAVPVPLPVAPDRQLAAVAELQGVRPPDGPGQAGPRPRGAAPADDGPAPAALPAPSTPVLALAPAPGTAPPSQAVAAVSAAPAAGVPPHPVPAAGQRPPASPGTAKEAARLLALGKALLAINQVADARELIKASADMGDSKAAALLATYDAAAQGRHAQTGPAQTERAGTRARPAARAAP